MLLINIITTCLVLAHKTSLTPPLCIEVPVPRLEGKRSGICVFGASMLSPSTIFPLDFEIVLTVWYFFCFVFHYITYDICTCYSQIYSYTHILSSTCNNLLIRSLLMNNVGYTFIIK